MSSRGQFHKVPPTFFRIIFRKASTKMCNLWPLWATLALPCMYLGWVPNAGETRLKKCSEWHEASPPMKDCCHPRLCRWQTFPHFLHVIVLISVNKQPKNHTTSHNFYYILFPPTVVFCGWNTYPIYHGSSREKCPCLSDFWCRDGIEPRTLFSRPQSWCQSF